jgi:PKHD-type hydroxylase
VVKQEQEYSEWGVPLESSGAGTQLRNLATNDNVTAVLTLPGFLSNEDCDRVVMSSKSRRFYSGEMSAPSEYGRDCDVFMQARTKGTAWLFERIESLVEKLNMQYQFRLTGLDEGLQFTRYRVGGHVTWHCDTGTGENSRRKLGISIQLSNAGTYVGGDLEFCPAVPQPFGRSRGTAIVFPATYAHRVSRVTRGQRLSLVTWMHGPPFR